MSRKKLFIGLGIGASLSAIAYALSKFINKQVIPQRWRKVGTLEQLYFYPIKSCAPIELDDCYCENLGVRIGDIKDRSLMLIDDNRDMVSARTYPKMFQIIPKIVGRTQMIISAPGMDDLEFDYSVIGDESNGDVQAHIYGNNVTVMECGDEYRNWFSQFILGKPEGLRLVYYPYPIPTRAINKDFVNGTKQDTGTFHDFSSYMMMNNSSLNELNSRLEDKISPLQFRANFYVNTTGPPFEEDNWQWIRIGEDAIFRNVGPPSQCMKSNINPFTAERYPESEKLKALKAYRIFSGAKTKSPGMGIQLGLRVPGSVKRGDDVYVEDISKK